MAIPFNPAEIAIAIEKSIDEEQFDIFSRFLKNVIVATPIDTGLAKGNWRVSKVKALEGVIARKSPAAALSQGLASIKAAKSSIKGRSKKPASIFIVNNLPYIGLLNQGYSPQAPAFYIEIAMQDAAKPRTPRRKNI